MAPWLKQALATVHEDLSSDQQHPWKKARHSGMQKQRCRGRRNDDTRKTYVVLRILCKRARSETGLLGGYCNHFVVYNRDYCLYTVYKIDQCTIDGVVKKRPCLDIM